MRMQGWMIWALTAAIFALAEMLTLALFMVPFALGALLALVSGLMGAPAWLQALVFLASSMGLVFALRPLARRHDNSPVLTGTATLAGQTAVVLQEVSSDSGLVKASGGDWTARSTEKIAVGARVHIDKVQGATLIVSIQPKEKI